MSQTKFSTLEDLVKHVKQQRQQKKLQPRKVVTPEERVANALARKIEEELKWKPAAIVLLTQHQHCRCGQDYRAILGVYVEDHHKTNGSRRLHKAHDFTLIDKLPHRREEFNEEIPICPHCLLERSIADAIINPVHDVTVQLPLFDHVLQYGEFT